MFKIAILGCENSHADTFLKTIKNENITDVEVVGVYSYDTEAAEKLSRAFGVRVAKNYDEFVGEIDGLVITARHGDNHYKYAKPYLDSKIPIFIDKPITISEKEAVEFMNILKENKIPACGGSMCIYSDLVLELKEAIANGELGAVIGGHIRTPLVTESEHGGFYFYSEHLVDVMLKIFGLGVKAVSAEKLKSSITLSAKYDNFNVLGTYVEHTGYYSASVYGSKSAKASIINFTTDSFSHEMNDMLALLKGEAMQKSYEEFILPVFIMNATLRALESGKTEKLNEIII